VPENDPFVYTFNEDVPEDLREPLERLCSRVVSLGHSASMVQVYLTQPKDPNYIPREDGRTLCRVTSKGYLEYLVQTYSQGERPDQQRVIRYGSPNFNKRDTTTLVTDFDPVVQIATLTQLENIHRLGLIHTQDLINYLRKMVLEVTGQGERSPGYLSGHNEDGTVFRGNHLAFFPIANIDHRHADGVMKAVGFALPRGLESSQRRHILQVLNEAQKRELRAGALGIWKISFDLPDAKWAKSDNWTDPSTTWATTTPFVFDRYRATEEGQMISVAESCRYIGLPPPVRVNFTPYSEFAGVPNRHDFPPYLVKDGKSRTMTHMTVEFASPVQGPVLLGAGRFKGYGVLRPIKDLS
jgi:CRISPR-associated protein Csb2